VAITASKDGFKPEVAEFVQNRPAFLEITRVDDTNCANAVRMPWMKEARDLPLGQKVSIQIPDTSQAGEFQYSCWMNMLFGKVVIKAPGDGD
jgi:plastocyanin domain-containing protein